MGYHGFDGYLSKSIEKELNQKNKNVLIASKNVQDYKGGDMSFSSYEKPKEKYIIQLNEPENRIIYFNTKA
jgi:hypothetical protein